MAAIPPETAAEIQKLEQLHGEHPEGRYFVPLGDRYRKLGMIEQAETLLREGLRRHPDYLSAHIVLGGCLADRGAIDDAAEEFRYVLSVDPQNLIALRTLGELAAAGGRGAEAERWYRELLAVDPMNKEARQALEVLAGNDDALDAEPEPSPAADFPSWDDPGLDEPEAMSGDGGLLLDDGPLIDLVGSEWADAVSSGSDDGGASDEAGTEFDALAFGDVSLNADERGEREQVGDAGLEPSPFGAGFSDIGGEAESSSELDGDEVITETIAELYTRQGFHDRAADVYRELIRLRGGDPILGARLADAERAARGEVPDEAPEPDALVFLDASATDDEEGADDEEWLAASFEDGFAEPGAGPEAPERPTIRAALADLLRWSPSPPAAAWLPQAPSESEPPLLSVEEEEPGPDDHADLDWLSDILGDPADAPQADDSMSDPSPSADPPSGEPTEPGSAPAAGADDDDLESFQAWLQSLKR
jgi:tetratricopeptide (TPR) repeat protein